MLELFKLSLVILDYVKEIMRHQINYIKDGKSWAVIDPRPGDKALSLIYKKEAETASDRCEEMHAKAAR